VRRTSLSLVAITLALASLVSRPASAALDPDTADGDTAVLVKAKDYAFCTKPSDPLSPAAHELCPLAGEVPGCGALVTACTKVDEPFELGPFWERIIKFLGRAAPYVAWAFIAGLVGLVGYLVVRAIRAAREPALADIVLPRGDVTLLPDAPLPDDMTPAEALLRLAEEARLRGDARTALHTYLAAALRALDDRGAIRVSKDRTNGEYVRECQETALRSPLRDLVREVDFVQFGGREATLDAAAAAQGRAERIVRAAPRPPAGLSPFATIALRVLGLVALICAGGCNKALEAFSHADPAGRGLLADLLEKQGATISSVPGSLAHLPMNGPKGAVVVLDAERVPLEEETRTHLVAWVNQGGALVLAGNPARWPSEFWVKPSSSAEAECPDGAKDAEAVVKLRVETRDRPMLAGVDDDDDDVPSYTEAPVHVHHAVIARRASITWPSEDRAPRAIAKLPDGELYGALRTFGRGKVLGLASADLLTNVSLAVPGNAAAIVAMLRELDRTEFAVARAEQGVAPPDDPFAGLLHVGLGPALLHALVFVPLLFIAYGVRHAAPRAPPAPARRAFAEHVLAVGGLYARRRAATHALAVYGRHVDDRVRSAMGRAGDPVDFLAARSGVSHAEAAELVARASAAEAEAPPHGDELLVLQKISAVYARAIAKG
jgi:hypothetical protein